MFPKFQTILTSLLEDVGTASAKMRAGTAAQERYAAFVKGIRRTNDFH